MEERGEGKGGKGRKVSRHRGTEGLEGGGEREKTNVAFGGWARDVRRVRRRRKHETFLSHFDLRGRNGKKRGRDFFPFGK